jgi:hypothetical protein
MRFLQERFGSRRYDLLRQRPLLSKANMARIDAMELPTLLRSIEVYEGRQLARLAIQALTPASSILEQPAPTHSTGARIP